MATMAASDRSVKMSRMKLNPVREDYQDYTGSVKITRQLIVERMFPLIVGGLERGIRLLRRSR